MNALPAWTESVARTLVRTFSLPRLTPLSNVHPSSLSSPLTTLLPHSPDPPSLPSLSSTGAMEDFEILLECGEVALLLIQRGHEELCNFVDLLYELGNKRFDKLQKVCAGYVRSKITMHKNYHTILLQGLFDALYENMYPPSIPIFP